MRLNQENDLKMKTMYIVIGIILTFLLIIPIIVFICIKRRKQAKQ